MKTLQNNFTTPEQSKQLLELGIPMNSADCIWYNPYYDGKDPELAEISVWKGKYPQRMDKYTYPCWSVGRLIEIYDICRCYDEDCDEVYGKETYIETFISAIEEAILDDMLDFSKLEE